MTRALAAALACACLLTQGAPLAASPAASPAVTTLGLQVHVATRDASAVVTDTFVETQVRRANDVFAPHRVRFEVAGRDSLPGGHAVMVSRTDRDALGAHVTPGLIDVFLVERLFDVHEPGRVRRGVHWRSRSHRPAHFVIVSSEAFEEVLAHELGHFLGNHRHSDTPGNLMSYTRRPGLPFLDAGQVRRMRRALSDYLARGELRAR